MPRRKAQEAPRIGRPPRSSSAADVRIALRITQDEHERWLEAAGDQSVSAWLRGVADRAARRAK